jgi:DNA polymerase III sliding clamp (beta) subunit (PCNA family)
LNESVDILGPIVSLADKKDVSPILSCILLTVKNNFLTLIASDEENELISMDQTQNRRNILFICQ